MCAVSRGEEGGGGREPSLRTTRLFMQYCPVLAPSSFGINLCVSCHRRFIEQHTCTQLYIFIRCAHGPRQRPAAPTRGRVVNTLPGPGRVALGRARVRIQPSRVQLKRLGPARFQIPLPIRSRHLSFPRRIPAPAAARLHCPAPRLTAPPTVRRCADATERHRCVRRACSVAAARVVALDAHGEAAAVRLGMLNLRGGRGLGEGEEQEGMMEGL
eukprot:scaffold1902_cov118-Isochrysis_galbana.AAC.2